MSEHKKHSGNIELMFSLMASLRITFDVAHVKDDSLEEALKSSDQNAVCKLPSG
jgi:hypothetical protein